jgi:outer membrane protein OmpA-like peptidoglycan-associated protein/tetratricopeptide (TPR) repeat protein
MTPTIKTITVTALLLLSVCAIFAQTKLADIKKDRLAYEGAIKQYEASLAMDSTNMNDWANVAECYRMIRKSVKAEYAYYKVINEGTPSADQYFYYGLSLLENEKYDQATKAAEDFAKAYPNDVRAKNLLLGVAKHEEMLATKAFFKVEPVSLNSVQNDMCPILYGEGIVFASNRGEAGALTNVHSWTGQKFLTLYYALGSEVNFAFPVPFAEEIVGKLNDGPACFSADGNTMYFTRNSVEDKKTKLDPGFKIKLKIFISTKTGNKWSDPAEFGFNGDDFNTCHPAISKDGSTLFFASDRPGGQGGMDIWKSDWDGSSWGNPINLGEAINTPGNELFPYKASNGDFYFSSNGQYGLGGLDIFIQEGSSTIQNVGAPINSSDDDFGICLYPDGVTGYFGSNRKAQELNDDIYYFKKQCANTDVKIVDAATGAILAGADVTVFENGIEKSMEVTDSTGIIKLCLNPLHNYEFRAKKNNYDESISTLTGAQIAASSMSGEDITLELARLASKEITLRGRVFNQDDKSGVAGQLVLLKNFTTGENQQVLTDGAGNYNFKLAADQKYEIGTMKQDCGDVKEPFSTGYVTEAKIISIDLPLLCKGDIVQIDNIYYDYNKSAIRSDAALELDKVVALMMKYPTMTIQLRSHTDARGKDTYNLDLSGSRAKSAREYIITKGISQDRLTAKGFGETELKNKCGNDINCTEEEHAINRRTEFKIITM